jgi:hypothetical protein
MNQPLDIDALEDLAAQFRQLGNEAATNRHRRRRTIKRPTRPVLIAAVTAVVLTCTASAATLVLREGTPLPEAPAGDFTADQLPLPETSRLAGVQTTDPAGGAPWGVRVFSNAAGAHCFAPGRVVDGKLGVISGGVFRELPLRGPGTCVQFNGREVPLGMVARYYPPEDRTAIYGVASPLVTSIGFQTGIRSQTVIPDSDGAYIAVFEGEPHVRRIITLTDGTRQVLDPPRNP